MNKTVYIREMKTTVAGPKPGLVNFIRWLFEPFQPPPPLELPPPDRQAAILLFLKKMERDRRMPVRK